MEDDLDSYLKSCVQIEPLALEEEYVRLPADLAFWNQRYSEVYRYWLERKVVLNEVRARIQIEERERLEMLAKGKRVTIGEVEDALILNPEYQQAKMKEIAAEAEKVRLWGVLDALRSKRDMLISLGAHIRAEMAHDPMIRKQASIDHEVKFGAREFSRSSSEETNPSE